MAQSRLEKIGTIYTRVTALLKTGAISSEDTPLWYNIYKAFPPKYEPRFDRTMPDFRLRNIFYEEDRIRAKFHKDVKNIPAVNLSQNHPESGTQMFLSMYQKFQQEGLLTDDAYDKALKQYKSKNAVKKEKPEQKRQTIDINNLMNL